MKKSLLSFVATAAFATLALVVSTPAAAHPGGLDKDGCHTNSKTGEYHCHQGSNAGMSYASEESKQKGSRGTPMESNASPKGVENSRREKAMDKEPVQSTKSRKLKDSNTDDKVEKTSKRTKTKEKADSDTSSGKSSARKKAKAGEDDASADSAKKTKKTSKKAKAEKSDASATDKDTKPKKTAKKKTKSTSTDDTASKP
jgi:hypothetical protein